MSAKRKVLVVDDDPAFVDMNKLVLEKNGYEVITAYDGDECLERVETGKPDLILLDIMMKSVGDGMLVAQKLRKDEATKHIPIIVVTAVNQTPPFNIGPDDGWLPVDVFIEKPVAPDVLLEQVKKNLGESSTHIEHRTP
jgi:CheY-like chemotaxis protein